MKATTNNSSDDDSSNNSGTPPPQQGGKGKVFIYIIAAVLIVAVIGVAYFLFSAAGGLGGSSQTTYNLSNTTGLNTQQILFVTDLKKAQSLSAMHVTYLQSNFSQTTQASANLSISMIQNNEIDSYVLGNQDKSIILDNIYYKNAATGAQIGQNLSDIYYYNTSSGKITCFNETVSVNGTTNASLQCANGDSGLSYLEQYPFTVTNVSGLGYLLDQGNLTYKGLSTVDGRSCDKFIISNETTSNLLSNYSVFTLCIDTTYGIPLYYNETDVVNGAPNATALTAINISTSFPSSDLTIPQVYLSNVSSGI